MPLPPNIKAPEGDLSPTPDLYTKTNPDFAAGENAANRVLHIDWKWFRYGTDDKGHAAALVLSMVLLAVSVFVIVVGLIWPQSEWLETVFKWLGGAFLFVSGVAIGKSADNK